MVRVRRSAMLLTIEAVGEIAALAAFVFVLLLLVGAI
jgi:hypothetical protein